MSNNSEPSANLLTGRQKVKEFVGESDLQKINANVVCVTPPLPGAIYDLISFLHLPPRTISMIKPMEDKTFTTRDSPAHPCVTMANSLAK